jgi:hypothetical protein
MTTVILRAGVKEVNCGLSVISFHLESPND